MQPKSQQMLKRSVRMFCQLLRKLHDNTVTVETLEMIIPKKDIFLTVAEVIEKNTKELPLTSFAFKNLLLCREKDLKRLMEVIETVEKLQFLFKEISERKILT